MGRYPTILCRTLSRSGVWSLAWMSGAIASSDLGRGESDTGMTTQRALMRSCCDHS
ncbi:hypothetical protein JB92DRAFT_2890040, partial [Gautieria morchelliformis]